VPRNLGHCAEETSGALGGIEQGQFLGNFAIEGKLLQPCEGKVSQTVVPPHHLGLIVSGGKGGVLLHGLWWIRIEGEGTSANGLVGWILLNRGGGKIEVQTVSSSVFAVSINFFSPRWRSSSATNSLGMTFSLGNRGCGSWRVVSLRKNGASIALNVAANALYMLEEDAVWKIGVLVEV
jgi:hypothetical protein